MTICSMSTPSRPSAATADSTRCRVPRVGVQKSGIDPIGPIGMVGCSARTSAMSCSVECMNCHSDVMPDDRAVLQHSLEFLTEVDEINDWIGELAAANAHGDDLHRAQAAAF